MLKETVIGVDKTQMNIHIKRVYAGADREGGKRILVDQLWPRGLTKEKAKVDLWLKDVTPSNELAGGSDMTRRNGPSSGAGIRKN